MNRSLSEKSRSNNSLELEALLTSGTVHLGANYNQLFTVEEAFVRLGQSGQNGELLVLNKDESVRVYVEGGFVVHAQARNEEGDAAVILALSLEASNFVWAADVKPPRKDLHIDIRQYVLRHSLSRDLQIAHSLEARAAETLALPSPEAGQRPAVGKTEPPRFYFISEVDPTGKIPLKKPVILIGRETYCDWVINDPRVSRKHCVLQLAARGVLVRNLETTNGTFINGKLTMDGYLKPHDKLSLGGYILTLQKF